VCSRVVRRESLSWLSSKKVRLILVEQVATVVSNIEEKHILSTARLYTPTEQGTNQPAGAVFLFNLLTLSFTC
jgi:hypothetical protein